MLDKVTVPSLASLHKAGKQIVCITAYDSTFGEIADEAGADLILVGDSVANTVLGYSTTVPVTLEQMIHHTAATRQGVKRALLVADLPFGSYQTSIQQAVSSAVALMKAGAEAVKLEGEYTAEIQAITKAGIPVMGHVGYTPQSTFQIGSPKILGKGPERQSILNSAVRLSESGAIGIVLELIPSEFAKEITGAVSCFTIGIGAGSHCSGQVQVLHDVLGLTPNAYKHSRRKLEGRNLAIAAIRSYVEDVRELDNRIEEMPA